MKSIVAAGALALATVSATPALACKCRAMTRDAAIAATPVVFEGRVLRVRRDGSSIYADVEMSRLLKGTVPRIVEVSTPASSAACGYEFRVGAAVTVGAQFLQQQFSTNACTMLPLNTKR